ncbi:SDR family oxidoreductase [Rhizorhabdus wittichii]|uniref:SDR family oxidoreductase n=1 Tax=Rhizorhabdus wittichii TaxID=160791 RepID=UPI0002F09CC1|nr:SDR family oxidoreductase [Rhizorhabdus wittichii]
MELSVKGKRAIVTGAGIAGAIGASFAEALARAGASVVVADIRAEGAQAVADSLAAQGLKVVATRVDISDPASVQALMDFAVERLGGLDIIVNNAALMAELSRVDIIDYPLEEWRRVFDVNLTGTMLCCTAAARHMRANGGGKIINIASGGAFELTTPYSISKRGVVSLTVLLANQLEKENIQVNAIAPGATETPAGLSMLPIGSAARDRFVRSRSGTPADMHGALLLLASSAGDWMSGQTLNVDGGWIKRS